MATQGCGTCGGNRQARAAQRPPGMTIGYITVSGGVVTGQYNSYAEAVRSGKGTPQVVNIEADGKPSPGGLRSMGVTV